GDVNGDGQHDIAVAHYSGSVKRPADDGISILLGDGRGGFRLAQRSVFAAGQGPVQVAIGGLSGGGFSDMAAANLASNDITVLLGDARAFAPARGSPFAVGRAPLALAIGDLNGDGKGDIVAANSADNDITLLLSR